MKLTPLAMLRKAIAQQIALSKQLQKTGVMSMRPLLEKKDAALIESLLAVHDALEQLAKKEG